MHKCFATDPKERPDFHEIFATLNNYHKKLEAAEPRQESTRRVRLAFQGGATSGGTNSTSSAGSITGAATAAQSVSEAVSGGNSAPGSTSLGTGGNKLRALLHGSDDTSEESDTESSSSSSDGDELERDSVLQYARVGSDVNSVLSATRSRDESNPAIGITSGHDSSSDSDSSEDDRDPRSFFPLLSHAGVKQGEEQTTQLLADEQRQGEGKREELPDHRAGPRRQHQHPVEVQ